MRKSSIKKEQKDIQRKTSHARNEPNALIASQTRSDNKIESKYAIDRRPSSRKKRKDDQKRFSD